jgi:RNA polymerase sigma factor (sigma-70 family)
MGQPVVHVEVQSIGREAPSVRELGRLRVFGDERLARSVTAGSSPAFSILYERYHKQLFEYCRSILRSDGDAHDAVQSTFMHALEALQRDRRNAPLRPWMFRIAHNEAISLIRRRRAGDELSVLLEREFVHVEDRADQREQLQSLLTDLQELPSRARAAILLRELAGLSHEEIAVALGTSVSGAKQAIFQARSALVEVAHGRAMRCEDVRRAVSGGDRRVLRGRRVRAHLRECPACAWFVDVSRRGERLRGLTPAFSAGAVTQLVSRIARSGSAPQTGASAATTGWLGTIVNCFVANSIGAAILATKCVLVTGVLASVAGAAVDLNQASPVRSVRYQSGSSSAPSVAQLGSHVKLTAGVPEARISAPSRSQGDAQGRPGATPLAANAAPPASRTDSTTAPPSQSSGASSARGSGLGAPTAPAAGSSEQAAWPPAATQDAPGAFQRNSHAGRTHGPPGDPGHGPPEWANANRGASPPGWAHRDSDHGAPGWAHRDPDHGAPGWAHRGTGSMSPGNHGQGPTHGAPGRRGSE